MKKGIRLLGYFFIYVLFVYLYTLNINGNINLVNLKVCLYSSVFPALVGGTVTNLYFR